MVTDSSGETDDDGIEMAASSSSFTISCEDVDTNILGKTEEYLKECDLGVFFKTHPVFFLFGAKNHVVVITAHLIFLYYSILKLKLVNVK